MLRAKPCEYFHALADETRLRCLLLLSSQGELCVCELSTALGLAQPKISRHLALLRGAGLVLDRRHGAWIYYRLDPTLPAWLQELLSGLVAAYGAAEPYRGDATRLTAMGPLSMSTTDAPVCPARARV